MLTKSKGWECPKCGGVMSPSYPTCWYCKPSECIPSLWWNDVRNKLPNDEEWKIVRCINYDEKIDFYYMAYYFEEEKKWEFFDGESAEGMQVTHWVNTPDIDFDIVFRGNS